MRPNQSLQRAWAYGFATLEAPVGARACRQRQAEPFKGL
jgi:hypothetical protein